MPFPGQDVHEITNEHVWITFNIKSWNRAIPLMYWRALSHLHPIRPFSKDTLTQLLELNHSLKISIEVDVPVFCAGLISMDIATEAQNTLQSTAHTMSNRCKEKIYQDLQRATPSKQISEEEDPISTFSDIRSTDNPSSRQDALGGKTQQCMCFLVFMNSVSSTLGHRAVCSYKQVV